MPSPKIHRCQCGCGKEVGVWEETSRANHRVKGEPKRFAHGHGTRRPIADRFWEKVYKRGSDECWEWTGSNNGAGYGTLYLGGRPVVAHRVSYELEHGNAAPIGQHVHHTCENRLCVNPRHLEAVGLVEHRERHRVTHCPQGHEYTPDNTLYEKNGYRRCRECKRRQGQEYYRRKKLRDGDV